MNNDGLQKLKDIGAQKICEDTHIPAEHIQAILHESFDGLSKIHFIGFVSILEREYNIDLSELKNAGISYYEEKDPNKTTKDGIFLTPKKSRNFTFFYILITMTIFLIALFYAVEYANKNMQNHNAITLDSTSINKAKENMNSIVYDTNVTQKDENKTLEDVNATQEKLQSALVLKEEKALPIILKVVAKSKVWMGYTDVKTNKKYQKTFKGEFDLDPNKEWLFIFGHGYISIVTGSQEKTFNTKKTLRVLYKNGEIRELSFDEYKKLSKGSAW